MGVYLRREAAGPIANVLRYLLGPLHLEGELGLRLLRLALENLLSSPAMLIRCRLAARTSSPSASDLSLEVGDEGRGLGIVDGQVSSGVGRCMLVTFSESVGVA